MHLRAFITALLLLLPILAGCSAESPFSVLGKPKVSGHRCAAGETCRVEAHPQVVSTTAAIQE